MTLSTPCQKWDPNLKRCSHEYETGQKCIYSHPIQSCPDYQRKGRCRFGDNCPYSHVQIRKCVYFQKGCMHGNKCRFAHDKSSDVRSSGSKSSCDDPTIRIKHYSPAPSSSSGPVRNDKTFLQVITVQSR